jgi:hypothetical protein
MPAFKALGALLEACAKLLDLTCSCKLYIIELFMEGGVCKFILIDVAERYISNILEIYFIFIIQHTTI